MTAGRVNQVRTLLQHAPWSHLARITAHAATWNRECVCGNDGGWGGRGGREGPSKHWSEWDISRFCAVLIMDHEATQTPPIDRCHTAALPNMQPSAPCKYQPTVQVYKTMSPHQRQQCHPQKHAPEAAHHLEVNQAQLMLQLCQVLHYAMLCIFPDLPRCVCFRHRVQNN